MYGKYIHYKILAQLLDDSLISHLPSKNIILLPYSKICLGVQIFMKSLWCCLEVIFMVLIFVVIRLRTSHICFNAATNL